MVPEKQNKPMSSREDILARVKANQPGYSELPDLPAPPAGVEELAAQFSRVVEAIGGQVLRVESYDRMEALLLERFPDGQRVVSGRDVPDSRSGREITPVNSDPHLLEDVGLAVLRAHFGIAENGACWITEEWMGARALPFIAQHLALVVAEQDIVPDMHAAYDRIASLETGKGYGFGTFIAGPSKTADIEQSLVLGAHGPASLTVFLLEGAMPQEGRTFNA